MASEGEQRCCSEETGRDVPSGGESTQAYLWLLLEDDDAATLVPGSQQLPRVVEFNS